MSHMRNAVILVSLPFGTSILIGCDFSSTSGTRGTPDSAKGESRSRAFATTIGRAVGLPVEIAGYRLRGGPKYSPSGDRLSLTTIDDGNIYVCGLDNELIADVRNIIGSDAGHVLNGCMWLNDAELLICETWMTDVDRNRFDTGNEEFAIRWSTRRVNLYDNASEPCSEYTGSEQLWIQATNDTRYETRNSERVMQIDLSSGLAEPIAVVPDGYSFATGWGVPAGFALAVRNLVGNLAGAPADMFLYDLSAQAVRNLTNVPYSLMGVVVADDGNYLVTIDPSERAVVLVNTHSNERRSLVSEFWIPVDYNPSRKMLLVNAPQDTASGGLDQFYEISFGRLVP